MELRQLKHFTVLARIKNYHRAAAELNLAQPSLTRSIQKLEQSLGVQLLERQPRNLILTHDGEKVLKQSHKILNQVTRLEQQFVEKVVNLNQ